MISENRHDRACSNIFGCSRGRRPSFRRSPGEAEEDFRFALRRGLPNWQAVLMGILCLCAAVWWFVTPGAAEERIIPPSKGLPSPAETFASFPSLWFDRALTRNLLTTLRRLSLGFGLATLVGVPLGVLCGCFPSGAMRSSCRMTLFGRNIPVAALIPLTFSLFGIGETQKVMFIFIACVAFVLWDTTRAIEEVGGQYIDTAYTLGAGTWQTIGKVLLTAGTAQRVQLTAAAVRPGVRLHHARRGREVRLGDGRARRSDQHFAAARPRRARAADPADHSGCRAFHRLVLFLRAGRAVSVPIRRHGNSATGSFVASCTPGKTCDWRSGERVTGQLWRQAVETPTPATAPADGKTP